MDASIVREIREQTAAECGYNACQGLLFLKRSCQRCKGVKRWVDLSAGFEKDLSRALLAMEPPESPEQADSALLRVDGHGALLRAALLPGEQHARVV
jgi:hypothetical protein